MSNISLYELSSEVERLLSSEDAFDPETGELSEALVAALDATKGKVVNVAAYILNLDVEIIAIEEHLKKIEARRARVVERQCKLRDYLAAQMKRTGIHEIKAHDNTFGAKLYIERDASVEVYDERLVPGLYWVKPKPPGPKISKAELSKALKAGETIQGARLVKKDRLEIK